MKIVEGNELPKIHSNFFANPEVSQRCSKSDKKSVTDDTGQAQSETSPEALVVSKTRKGYIAHLGCDFMAHWKR
jgi:hypothetical protein